MSNFVSYSNAQSLMAAVGAKLQALNGAYVIKGNSAFASLPATPTESQAGFVYNVTDAFTTDARFVEGTGKKYSANTNVVIVDNSSYAAVTPAGSEDPSDEGWYEIKDGKYVLSADTTVDAGKTYYAKTVLVQYDVIANFVDVDGIEAKIVAVAAMIADKFDATQSYLTGDIVTYENVLYKFSADHAAGAWTGSDATVVTVESLLNAEITSRKAVDTAIFNDIAATFDAANAYNTGAIVLHDNGLFKFKADHTAGDPWDATEVDTVTIADLISAAEPDELTTAQVNALIALL